MERRGKCKGVEGDELCLSKEGWRKVVNNSLAHINSMGRGGKCNCVGCEKLCRSKSGWGNVVNHFPPHLNSIVRRAGCKCVGGDDIFGVIRVGETSSTAPFSIVTQ